MPGSTGYVPGFRDTNDRIEETIPSFTEHSIAPHVELAPFYAYIKKAPTNVPSIKKLSRLFSVMYNLKYRLTIIGTSIHYNK